LRTMAAEVRDDSDVGTFLWIKIANPAHREVDLMAELFDLPALQIDDALNKRQRPKLEIHGERAFVILKELRYTDEMSAVDTGQVAVFLGPGYVISIRIGDAAPGSARERLARHLELTRYGPSSVLYAILDVIADGYLEIVEHLSDDLVDLEDRVFSMASSDNASMVYNLKRENLEVKRAISPLIGEARVLVSEQQPEIPHQLGPYFRDIGDHVLRANDMVESHDQLLMTMLMAATSQQDLQQNKDMRKISAWAAIIAVPTAIAGIYGMNLEDMPELKWSFGYPMVLIIMLIICGFLYRQFKKSGWL
jgi:magnesium transporter